MDSPETPPPPAPEAATATEEDGSGITRGSLVARAGVLAAGGALAASGLGLARPGLAFGQNGDDNEIAPPPPSVGADVPVTYFGPTPSQVKKELVGPVQLLRSGEVDLEALTITLPLYKGRVGNQTVWFVLTDTSDVSNADALGLLPAFKLEYADTGRAVRTGRLQRDGSVVFNRGTVNFAPAHQVVPGAEPNPFPPRSFQPGSGGDLDGGADGDAFAHPRLHLR